jgi:hypothetical protein
LDLNCRIVESEEESPDDLSEDSAFQRAAS